jgi:tetratricopeptide (TPR) repeat protein
MQSETETYYASLYLAQSYAALGRYDQGRQVLEDYLRRYSDNAITRWYLAQNSVCLGKYDLALVDADKAALLNPGMYQNQILKGDICHLQGEWARSEQEYRTLLEKEEPAARIYGKLSLAALFLARGRFGGAIAELEQANALAGELGETSIEFSFLRYLASVYLKSGKSDKASEVIEKAGRIAAATGDFTEKKSYLYDRAIIDLEGGRLAQSAKSAEDLKKLISESANPKEIRHYDFIIGMIELKKKDYGLAAKFFRKALSLVPSQYAVNNEHAPFRDGLAAAYFGAGDLDKAQSEYEKITELTIARLYYGDIYAKSFYWLGRIQGQKGIKTKARESYQRFLVLWKEAEPGLPEVEDARRRMAEL